MQSANSPFGLYYVDRSVGLAVTGGDASVRTLPGRAKRVQTKHFQLFLDNTAELISIMAADGTVCYESPACERVLGYTPEDVTGKILVSFVYSHDTPALRTILTEALD